MQIDNIRDKIEEVLLGVDGVGHVHKYIRHIVNPTELKDNYVYNGNVNAWEFSYLSTLVNDKNMMAYRTHRVRSYRLLGIYGLRDQTLDSDGLYESTSIEFERIVERVLDAFTSDIRYEDEEGNRFGKPLGQDPCSLVGLDQIMARVGSGNVLCHRAEIRINVESI